MEKGEHCHPVCGIVNASFSKTGAPEVERHRRKKKKGNNQKRTSWPFLECMSEGMAESRKLLYPRADTRHGLPKNDERKLNRMK